MGKQRSRLIDIAAVSGVSVGTVDRVLHERGEVAEQTRKRVLKVAADLNYTPDLMARSLKTRKQYNIVSLIPAPTSENQFWVKHPEGMKKAVEELEQFPLNITEITFDLNSEADFLENKVKALKLNPDGIILAPVFKSECLTFCSLLKKKGIPFVFVDNFLRETEFLAYVGEDVFKSGKVAGQLADLVTPHEKDILIINIARNLQNMHHLNSRMKGFLSYFTEKGLNRGKKLKLNLPSTDKKVIKEMIKNTFERNPSIVTVFITGSKSYKIAEYLNQENYDHINVIGYDLLPKNISCLRKGQIRFLIGQRPEEQTYKAVKKMFEYLSLKKIPEKIEYLPVDIVTSENVDFFINNQ